jgi:hypothetical protein
MRSGRDVPGRDDAAEQPGPAGFPAEAIKPTLVRIVGTILAAWTVGGILRLAATPKPITVTVYYAVLFAGIAAHRWGRLGPTIVAHALTNLFVTMALIA